MNPNLILGRLAGLALIAGMVSALPAHAEDIRTAPRAVVELFTSQGCASCPPADALLSELARDEGIIALAYHVNYWDYAGWADTFGNQAYSDRQRAYAAGWSSSRIYTPQMVINGQKGVVGSKEYEVRRALGQAQLPIPIALEAADGMLEISIDGQAGLEPAMIWVVSYIEASEVTIERGDNEGQSILYSQVVTGRQALGLWDPGSGAHIRMPIADMLGENGTGVAILIQPETDGVPGPIIGAALYHP